MKVQVLKGAGSEVVWDQETKYISISNCNLSLSKEDILELMKIDNKIFSRCIINDKDNTYYDLDKDVVTLRNDHVLLYYKNK